MKILIIVVLVIIIAFALGVSGKKRIQQDKENKDCLTIENYFLIQDSPYADELGEYIIIRDEDKLRFTTKDRYTLFFLELRKEEETTYVKLVGLAMYGAKDKIFLAYTCDLINKISEKNKEMNLQNENNE